MGIRRIAGLCYVVTFAAGITGLLLRGSTGAMAVGIASLSYVVVTVLLYWIFKPGGAALSLVAALVSLFAILAGALRILPFNTLTLFGVYCVLLSVLASRLRSAPRVLTVLLALAGVGWLAFAVPGFATAAYPWNLVPGIIGEGALTVWLLVSEPQRREALA
jgi:hypothetical protein